MRLILLALVAACAAEADAPVATPAPARTPTFEVAFVDTLDGAAATHIAVGGRLRVRLPDAATSANAVGPFAIATDGDHVVITATGPGAGEIEIETLTGYTRFALSAAPIASVGIVVETQHRARVALRDANGKSLVDASLRVAPGRAPVSFLRDAWDRVELGSTGDIFVKTDLLGATRAIVERAAIAIR